MPDAKNTTATCEQPETQKETMSKLHRQETPNSVGGGRKSRKSMYQVQATSSNSSNGTVNRSGYALSHQQELVLAQEAPLCLLIQTSYQNLIPEPHTTTCQRISRDRQRAFYTEGLRRRTRTCYEHPRRTFLQAQMQSIFKVLMQGHLEEDLNRISTRPLLTMIMDPKDFFTRTFSGSSHQDLYTRSCQDL